MQVGDKVKILVLIPKGNFNPAILPGAATGVISQKDNIRDWVVRCDGGFDFPFREDEIELMPQKAA